ncbi:hypothetical protein OG241_26060 [Streptomyces sp. NBC_01390]|uniref:hypothetical protein n=1 Tax=Streptomyces sp. NBC_01390 TaxID=2903850 RepID=UPI003253A9AE
MSDVMVMYCSGWTFEFDGRSLTVTRRGTPWRRKRVERLPLARIRSCYLLRWERQGDGIESHDFWLVHDTGVVRIGISREYFKFGDAYWFAKYLNAAMCERLRWVLRNTIGLGPHPEAELLPVLRSALQSRPPSSSVRDVLQRLDALCKEGPSEMGRQTDSGPTRPFDLQTNHDRVLGGGSPNFETWWTFVEHIRAGYEPTDEPGWEEVVQDVMRGRLMLRESNRRQHNRSGYPNRNA